MVDEQQANPVVKVELKRLGLQDFVNTDDLLAKSPLFQYLDERGRETLLAGGTPRRFAAAAPIFIEASDGDSLFLVLRGDVSLSHGRVEGAIEVGSVRRGEYFGETYGREAGKRRYNAVASTEADVAEFPRELVAKLGDKYPLFGAALRETSQARDQAGSELDDFLNRW